MIRRFDETGNSQIGVVEPVEDATAYGVVDCKGVEPCRAKVPMVGVAENQSDVAPLQPCDCRALCVLSADIWALLAKLSGRRG